MYFCIRRLFIVGVKNNPKLTFTKLVQKSSRRQLFLSIVYSENRGKNKNGTSSQVPTSTLFVPVPVKPSPDDINVGAELTGTLNKGELLKVLNKFYQKQEIKILSLEYGIDSK